MTASSSDPGQDPERYLADVFDELAGAGTPLQATSGYAAAGFFWQPGQTADPRATRRIELLARAVGLAACGCRKDEEHAARYRDQQRIAADLRHRLRNNLAVLRSIIRRSSETADSAEHFALHLEARIGALARMQGTLAAIGRAVEVRRARRLERLPRGHLDRERRAAGNPVRGGRRLTMMERAASLLGLCVLVVEDDYFIAIEMCRALRAAGADVIGPARDLETGLGAIRDERIDCSVLDINLHGRMAFELATQLRARNIPTIFAAGYDASMIPDELATRPAWRNRWT